MKVSEKYKDLGRQFAHKKKAPETSHYCPECITEYFENIGECDWCPGVVVIKKRRVNDTH